MKTKHVDTDTPTGPGDHTHRRPHRQRAAWRRLLSTLGTVLLVASVVKELRTPKEQRTWHGVLLGFVPYELRFPSLQRLKDSLWDPASHRLLTSRVFGVGWSVNLHEVWVRLRTIAGQAPTPAPPPALSPAI